MIGRGTRRHPGKNDCLVLDLVGSTTRHHLQTAADLFGVPPTALEAQPLTVAVAAQAVAQEEARGRRVAAAVDLFRQRPLHWIESSSTRYALSIKDGLVLLQTDDGETWRVEHVTRDRRHRVLAEQLSLAYAQGVGEDEARRLGAGRLVTRKAAWRQHPATPEQLRALDRWRVPIPVDVTKGAASDLIAAAAARVA